MFKRLPAISLLIIILLVIVVILAKLNMYTETTRYMLIGVAMVGVLIIRLTKKEKD